MTAAWPGAEGCPAQAGSPPGSGRAPGGTRAAAGADRAGEIERLADERARDRALLDASTDALGAVDLHGNLSQANGRLGRLLGRTPGRLLGAPFRQWFLNPGAAAETLDRALRSGHALSWDLRLDNGEQTPVSLSAAIYRNPRGEAAGAVFSVRDTAGQPDREGAPDLTRAGGSALDQAAADLVSRVSHELRSPLTGVLGYLELLRAGRAGPLTTEQQRVAGLIARNAERLLGQIEELLTMSRIEARSLALEKAPLDFGSLVAATCEEFETAIWNAGLRLELRCDRGVDVEGDPGRLRQVVANLISNAVKFTPQAGEIHVTAAGEGEAAVLRVRDSGIGVPPSEQGSLFTRFFRSSRSEEAQIPGTGIGLFIVRQIVEAHGGTVTADSAPGGGSTFTVRLPRRAAGPPGARAGPDPAHTADG